MAERPAWTRRKLLAAATGIAAAGALAPRPSAAQKIVDLRGLDPLWKNAEDAIHAFFPRTTFESDGLDIDLPQHTDAGSSVPITVRFPGEVTPADFPRVVHILGHGNPTAHILSAWFSPAGGKAEFSTRIRLEKSQKVTAVAELTNGRHIRVDKEISVAFGACAQIGTGTNDDIFAFQPQPRVSVPPTAARGAIVPVRALISHPMETGLRLDAFDEWVRQRIISRFECTFEGQSVFRARLYPAVATNPYFQFWATAERSGAFEFSWFDMTDKTYTARAAITVS